MKREEEADGSGGGNGFLGRGKRKEKLTASLFFSCWLKREDRRKENKSATLQSRGLRNHHHHHKYEWTSSYYSEVYPHNNLVFDHNSN